MRGALGLNRFNIGLNKRLVGGVPAVLSDGNTVAWYDYQENVTKDGSNFVSVWGDKSDYTLGAEKTTNGNFSAWTGDNPDWWIVYAEDANNYVTENPAGECQIVSNGTVMGIYKTALLTVGKVYKVDVECTARTSGSLNVGTTSGQIFGTVSSVGSHSFIAIASNANFAILRSGACDITIDNVSIKEISGNHLIQSTGTNQPLYTANGILFDGIDNFMKTAAFTLNQPEFIYMVVKQVTWTVNEYIIDGNTFLSGAIQAFSTSPIIRAYAGSASAQISDLVVGSYAIVRVLFNGASSKLQVNENTADTGDYGAANMGGFTLGAAGNNIAFSNIETKEIIIRKTADGATDEASIYQYLADKYSIS